MKKFKFINKENWQKNIKLKETKKKLKLVFSQIKTKKKMKEILIYLKKNHIKNN